MPELLNSESNRLSRLANLLRRGAASGKNSAGMAKCTAIEICYWPHQLREVKRYKGIQDSLRNFFNGLVNPDDYEECVPDFEIFNWLTHPPKLNWQIAWDWAPR
jgi:hypothetical protein